VEAIRRRIARSPFGSGSGRSERMRVYDERHKDSTGAGGNRVDKMTR
jgi:hypothetical protein